MWIRILGILYNLSLVHTIDYNVKHKTLYLNFGACGSRRDNFNIETFVEHDVIEISFKAKHYGNEYGLVVYEQLIKKLRSFDDAEFITSLDDWGDEYESQDDLD